MGQDGDGRRVGHSNDGLLPMVLARHSIELALTRQFEFERGLNEGRRGRLGLLLMLVAGAFAGVILRGIAL